MKQQITEIKEDVRALKENLTGGPRGNGLLYEVKQQLAELKEEIRTLKLKETDLAAQENEVCIHCFFNCSCFFECVQLP